MDETREDGFTIKPGGINGSSDEASMGPYRPIRTGEKVEKKDVVEGQDKVKRVPERIYGGRRTRLTPLIERRKPQS